MKKKILIAIVAVLLLIGGFFVVKGFTETGVPALDDSFTRDFLDEDVEVDEGFYLFESKNGNYSMWFPEDYYILNDTIGFQSSPQFETISINRDYDASSNTKRSLEVDYRGKRYQTIEDVDNQLDKLLEVYSFNNMYEEYKKEDKNIYYGSSYLTHNGNEIETLDPEEHKPNRFFGLIYNEDGSEYLTIRYQIMCQEESTCEINKDKEQNFFLSMLENIEFK